MKTNKQQAINDLIPEFLSGSKSMERIAIDTKCSYSYVALVIETYLSKTDKNTNNKLDYARSIKDLKLDSINSHYPDALTIADWNNMTQKQKESYE